MCVLYDLLLLKVTQLDFFVQARAHVGLEKVLQMILEAPAQLLDSYKIHFSHKLWLKYFGDAIAEAQKNSLMEKKRIYATERLMYLWP